MMAANPPTPTVPTDADLLAMYVAELERKPCSEKHIHIVRNQTVELMRQVRDRARDHYQERINQLDKELKEAKKELSGLRRLGIRE